MLQVWLVGWLASWCGRDKKFRTTVTLRAPFWLLLVFSLAYRKMLQKNPAKLISNGKGIQPKSTFNILHYQIFINFMFVIFHLVLNYNLLLPIFAVPKAFLPVLFFRVFFSFLLSFSHSCEIIQFSFLVHASETKVERACGPGKKRSKHWVIQWHSEHELQFQKKHTHTSTQSHKNEIKKTPLTKYVLYNAYEMLMHIPPNICKCE